jgi:hypothetical protein
MRSKGAALALTLPGVGNRLLAAATYATHDPALDEQKMETAEMETAKCDVFRATFFRPRTALRYLVATRSRCRISAHPRQPQAGDSADRTRELASPSWAWRFSGGPRKSSSGWARV